MPLGLTPTDVAWLAGIVDGEGYVDFRGSPTIQVETVSPELVYEPEAMFGGSVTHRIKKNTRVFRWSIYGKKAVELLLLMLPYLRYKKPQAEIVICCGKFPVKSAMRASNDRRLRELRKKRYGST